MLRSPSFSTLLEVLATMLIRSLLSTHIPSLRYFSSSSAPSLLKIGDSLKKKRTFSNEDVTEYAKVTYDYNPVHFDSESARTAGYDDRLVHGMLVATMFPLLLSSNFVSQIFLWDFSFSPFILFVYLNY